MLGPEDNTALPKVNIRTMVADGRNTETIIPEAGQIDKTSQALLSAQPGMLKLAKPKSAQPSAGKSASLNPIYKLEKQNSLYTSAGVLNGVKMQTECTLLLTGTRFPPGKMRPMKGQAEPVAKSKLSKKKKQVDGSAISLKNKDKLPAIGTGNIRLSAIGLNCLDKKYAKLPMIATKSMGNNTGLTRATLPPITTHSLDKQNGVLKLPLIGIHSLEKGAGVIATKSEPLVFNVEDIATSWSSKDICIPSPQTSHLCILRSEDEWGDRPEPPRLSELRERRPNTPRPILIEGKLPPLQTRGNKISNNGYVLILIYTNPVELIFLLHIYH